MGARGFVLRAKAVPCLAIPQAETVTVASARASWCREVYHPQFVSSGTRRGPGRTQDLGFGRKGCGVGTCAKHGFGGTPGGIRTFAPSLILWAVVAAAAACAAWLELRNNKRWWVFGSGSL
jgi:hypothetical protein